MQLLWQVAGLTLLLHVGSKCKPHLTTFHNRLDLPGLPSIVQKFPFAAFISISDNQRRPLQEANWLGTVYHGMLGALLQPSFDEGRYPAFLGRLTVEKGPEAAIRIAKASGLPLLIACKLRQSNEVISNKLSRWLMVDGTHIKISQRGNLGRGLVRRHRERQIIKDFFDKNCILVIGPGRTH